MLRGPGSTRGRRARADVVRGRRLEHRRDACWTSERWSRVRWTLRRGWRRRPRDPRASPPPRARGCDRRVPARGAYALHRRRHSPNNRHTGTPLRGSRDVHDQHLRPRTKLRVKLAVVDAIHGRDAEHDPAAVPQREREPTEEGSLSLTGRAHAAHSRGRCMTGRSDPRGYAFEEGQVSARSRAEFHSIRATLCPLTMHDLRTMLADARPRR